MRQPGPAGMVIPHAADGHDLDRLGERDAVALFGGMLRAMLPAGEARIQMPDAVHAPDGGIDGLWQRLVAAGSSFTHGFRRGRYATFACSTGAERGRHCPAAVPRYSGPISIAPANLATSLDNAAPLNFCQPPGARLLGQRPAEATLRKRAGPRRRGCIALSSLRKGALLPCRAAWRAAARDAGQGAAPL